MKNSLFIVSLTILCMLGMAGCTNSSDGTTSSDGLSAASSEAMAPASSGAAASSDSAAGSGTTGDAAASSAPSQTAPANTITAEEARGIALAHAGLTEGEVTFIKAKLDVDNGKQIYEVEFYSGSMEYDYDIDAVSGSIISYDHEVEGYTAPSAQSEASGEYIGEERAKAIALAEVPGAAEGDIRLYLDYDDGRAVYEGSIIYDGMEYEFEIDAVSGSIVSWEVESVYDD